MQPVHVVVHRPEGDVIVRYEGMDVQAISNMLSGDGLTGTVVTKEEYDAFIAAQPK